MTARKYAQVCAYFFARRKSHDVTLETSSQKASSAPASASGPILRKEQPGIVDLDHFPRAGNRVLQPVCPLHVEIGSVAL